MPLRTADSPTSDTPICTRAEPGEIITLADTVQSDGHRFVV
jgi:predicted DNA-binding protein with PD1-like motif